MLYGWFRKQLAGRVAVAEVAAERLVSWRCSRTREDEVAWATHLDACASWTAARDELVRQALQAAELAAQRAGRGGGDSAQAGGGGSSTDGGQWESTPPPTWNGRGQRNARFLHSAE